MAESFFARLRRSEIGIGHRFAGPYLNAYADEMAWREDNRRVSNGEQYLIVAMPPWRTPRASNGPATGRGIGSDAREPTHDQRPDPRARGDRGANREPAGPTQKGRAGPG